MNNGPSLVRTLLKRTALLAVVLFIPSCSSSPETVDGISVDGDFDITVFAEGFNGPTQMVFGPNGDLYVAELNGGENDATGRILRLSVDDPSQRAVLQQNLDKPTGLAVFDDQLWIMERDRLSVTTLDADAPREVIAEDLPNNGRSEGTLTTTSDGGLYYNTSGSKRGPDRVPGSGTLFLIPDVAGQAPIEPQIIATGFKHAYAHVIDPDGQLWTVEMTDGRFDGERGADELVAIKPGDDGGWPQCVDDNRPVADFGGTAESCASSPRSHALFGAGATPTSLVLAPWDDDLFIVALWLPSRVVTVPRSPSAQPHEPVDFISGIESPQHLLVAGERLLLSDHETGRIFEVTSR